MIPEFTEQATLGSVSERTLHSLNLSCNNGLAESSKENLTNGGGGGGDDDTGRKQQDQREGPSAQADRANGVKSNVEGEQLTSAKKPSYLGLACSISGYSGITRYDSKLREGFRSRDSSPGSRLITRETSPAGFRSSENLGVPGTNPPTKSQSISPLAMERRNGFSNGTRENDPASETRRGATIASRQDYSEVDRGLLRANANFSEVSPIRSISPIKRTFGTTQIGSFVASSRGESRNYAPSLTVSSPRSGHNLSNDSFGETSFANGSTSSASALESSENRNASSSSSSEKSFIQQRVERLYGPGALAQGFFFKRGSAHNTSSDSGGIREKSCSNENDSFTDNANFEESLKSLPVLRHLRPEFRAQLPVASPRRATDGTEQIIKPLQRISLTPQRRKNEANAKVASNTSVASRATSESRKNESIKLSAGATSIPDQQPAAPEVVLPVLEAPGAATRSTSAEVIDERAIEQTTKNTIEEKHGHHFMRLLNTERDRLISQAESAEAELANAAPGSLPEEAEGKLRSAAGKARLLAKQKMQQFEGLCHKNISQLPGEKFPTTYEDLAGFWDMVMLQVVQVNEIFAQIERSKSSQWQETTPEKREKSGTPQNGNVAKRRNVIIGAQKPKNGSAMNEANKRVREAREQARRKMMEERRRAMRNVVAGRKDNDDVTIFAPET